MTAVTPRERRRVGLAFGCVLRDARGEAGLSQEQLALLADFDRTYVSLLERGLRSPTLAFVLKVAVVVQVDAARLVSRTVLQIKLGEEVRGRRTKAHCP